MPKTILRWILPTAALLLLGPIVGALVAALRDSNGSPDATLLVSTSPLLGLLALLLLTLFAGAGGAVTARLTNPGTARTFAGLCAAWAAIRTADSWNMLMVHGPAVITPLAIEALLVAAAGVVITAALMVAGGSHDHAAFRRDLTTALKGAGAPLGIAVGVAGGAVAAWLVALDGIRGQCLMAGVLGSVLAAVGVQLASPNLTFDQARLRATAAVLLLALLSPLSLLIMPGAGAIADAARTGSLVGPGLVQPLDWLVGLFLGIPTGLHWVGSVAEKAQQQHAPR
jgi:hypothetical protein